MLLGANKSLNKNIPIPLYYQLKTLLLEYINDHRENPEEPIPTEVEISQQFSISRPTVRQAINELVVEGYLYRIKAKGTFITKSKITQDFLSVLDSFNNEMKKKGLTPSTKVLEKEIIKCDEKVSHALGVETGSDVIKLTRLRSADNEPVVFISTYVPYSICPGLLSYDMENESLYEIIEKESDMLVSRADRTLELVSAGEFEAKLLKIRKGSPIQFIESVVYLENDTPVVYSHAKYRGDRSKFSVELKRQLR
ncbi:MAG TPA: GntR family transcriptional regulator [Clostridia bacterium]|nr:GntR family transcriptional regulator [Clostridia bacterium]